MSGKLQVHASDLVRAAAGLSIGLVISLFAARGFILDLEVNVFRLVNELPEGLLVPLEVIMQLGALAAAPALALVAIAAGRRRFGVDLAIAGSAAWMIARVVKMIADRGRPDALLAEIVVRGAPAHGLGFASGHTAVAACLATVAAGHTKRPVRYLCWSLAITVGIARIYVGAHFPLDVVAGAFLGWAVGSTVRFIRGTPAFSPTTAAVMAGLQRLGLPATSVDRLDVHASGSIPCIATLADGSQLMVKAISSHHRDADLLYTGCGASSRSEIPSHRSSRPSGRSNTKPFCSCSRSAPGCACPT